MSAAGLVIAPRSKSRRASYFAAADDRPHPEIADLSATGTVNPLNA